MIGRHLSAPLIHPGDEALNARDDAALRVRDAARVALAEAEGRS